MSTTLDENLLLAIPLAPLVGSLIAGLAGKAVGRMNSHSVTILGVAISFVLSAMVFLQVMHGASFNGTIYEWMNVGSLKMEVGFLVDSLTAMMMVIVTFVSLMVHIYTIGYMAEDDGYERFFSYISLFTFSMLMLVMGDNLLSSSRLGRRGSLLVPADRLLLRATRGTRCRQEGVHRQPRRRLRVRLGIMLCFLAFGRFT